VTLPTGDVYKANSNGLSTLPCGTQDVQPAGVDGSAPTETVGGTTWYLTWW